MYVFGKSSEGKLLTVREDLRSVPYRVLGYQIFDFTIVWGWRGEEVQNQAFLSGASDKEWPNSMHNHMVKNEAGLMVPESLAFDFAPWCMLPSGKMGIPWKDEHAFAVLGGMFIAAGAELGVLVVYGGDWDMDGTTTDQNLMDWGHAQVMIR